MLELRCGEEQVPGVQIHQDLRVCILYEQSCKGSLRRHGSVSLYKLYEGQIIFPAHTSVILTESRCDMHDTGTVGHGYIVICHDEMCLLMLLFRLDGRSIPKRFILSSFQILSYILLQDLICLAVCKRSVFRISVLILLFGQSSEDSVQKSLCHDVGITVAGLHLHIGLRRIHAECQVGGQGPGRGGPCQEIILLFAFCHLRLETDDGRALLYGLISLSYLVGGKGSSAARAIGHNLEALVQKTHIPDLLQRPPFGFDIIIMISDIWVIHVSPEADLTGELLPHTLVLPHGFLTFLDKRFDAVLFDLFLAVDADLLLNLQLHRESVGIPARLPDDLMPLHGLISGDHVLDDPGQHVADVRLSVRGRRSVIECVGGKILLLINTLLKDLVLIPEIENLLFILDKSKFVRNLVVHSLPVPFSETAGAIRQIPFYPVPAPVDPVRTERS